MLLSPFYIYLGGLALVVLVYYFTSDLKHQRTLGNYYNSKKLIAIWLVFFFLLCFLILDLYLRALAFELEGGLRMEDSPPEVFHIYFISSFVPSLFTTLTILIDMVLSQKRNENSNEG